MKKMTLILLFLIGTSASCKKTGLFQDDELSLSRQNYTENQLKLEGYYSYGEHTVFFYKNGVVLHGYSFLPNELQKMEQSYKDGTFYNEAKNIKFLWGVYQIEGSNIKFERWYTSEKPYKSYVREGDILNDTTFRITQSYRIKNGKKTEVSSKSETYHFKHFSPKPDSTNSFIE